MFLIRIFCRCYATTNGFNNATQFFCLCFCFCLDIKVWACFVQISALKWAFTLNFQTQRQREGGKHFILGALLISSTALDWALLSTLPPSHPHYYTAANPVSQIPAPWTPSRKSYWCCTFLYMLQHVGMFYPPDYLCLLQACFPYVFFCKSPHESLHPLHNQHCLKHADDTNPRNTGTRTRLLLNAGLLFGCN